METELTYIFVHDGDAIPLGSSLTIGRHIDNDIVVAGEDVLDFHLRLDLGDRGPQALPLGSSNFTLNGSEIDHPVGLIVGDVLGIGSATLTVGVERELPSRIHGWRLVADDTGARTEIGSDLLIGRHPECGLQVASEHVSRRHARIVQIAQALWLQDLGSANGTRVNDRQVRGGCRLLHGDHLHFDEVGYRLHGVGEHLTMVRTFGDDDLKAHGVATPQAAADTAPIEAESDAAFRPHSRSGRNGQSLPPIEPSIRRRASTAPQLQPGQARLVGISESVTGRTWPIPLGRSRLGRSPQCEIRLDVATMAPVHSEIVARPGQIVITGLMTDAGLQVNHQPARVADLKDGDLVEIGGVTFRFQQARTERSGSAVNWRRSTLSVLVLLLVVAVVLLWF